MIDLTCEVCKKNTAKGVGASPLGPISFAYCQSCLTKNAEPYWLLTYVVADVGGLDKVADWVKKLIPGSLEVANKTQEEFLQDIEEEKIQVAQMYEQYEQQMKHNESEDWEDNAGTT